MQLRLREAGHVLIDLSRDDAVLIQAGERIAVEFTIMRPLVNSSRLTVQLPYLRRSIIIVPPAGGYVMPGQASRTTPPANKAAQALAVFVCLDMLQQKP